MLRTSPRGLFAACLLALAAAFSPAALAQSLTGNVGSADVSAGERAYEFRIGISEEGDIGSRAHFDVAFNDWYQLRTIAAFAQPDAEDWEFRGLTFENWFQWREEGEDGSGYNGGLRLAYTFAEGSRTDEVAARLTLTDKLADGWEWRANLIGEIEAGSGSEGGVNIGSRAQVSRAMGGPFLGARSWRLGAEVFSEYGNSRDLASLDEQAHQIGPVVKAGWDNGVYVQAAARVGLTDGSDDGMIKLFIGREF